MTNQTSDVSQRQAAIVAGVAILIMAVAAVVATDLALGRLVVPGDAAATFHNIQASEMLFRTGIFSWLIILVCDVLAAWGLYVFFKPVNKSLSLLTAWLRLVYAAILGTALAHLIRALLLVRGDAALADMGVKRLQAHVLLSVQAFDGTWSLGLVVFGLHILMLGYLAFKSGYTPKIFGVLLMIAFLGYVLIHSAHVLVPGYENSIKIIEWILLIPMVVGEVGLAVWLLIKGGKSRPRAQ